MIDLIKKTFGVLRIHSWIGIPSAKDASLLEIETERVDFFIVRIAQRLNEGEVIVIYDFLHYLNELGFRLLRALRIAKRYLESSKSFIVGLSIPAVPRSEVWLDEILTVMPIVVVDQLRADGVVDICRKVYNEFGVELDTEDRDFRFFVDSLLTLSSPPPVVERLARLSVAVKGKIDKGFLNKVYNIPNKVLYLSG